LDAAKSAPAAAPAPGAGFQKTTALAAWQEIKASKAAPAAAAPAAAVTEAAAATTGAEKAATTVIAAANPPPPPPSPAPSAAAAGAKEVLAGLSEVAAGAGKLLTVYGATTVGMDVSTKLQKAGSPFITSNLYGGVTLVLGVIAGAVDDAAIVTPFAPIVFDSWKTQNAGPAQVAVGQAMLALGMLGLKWDKSLGLK
jgi:hypothetical protein